MVKKTARAKGVSAESLEVILDLSSAHNIGYGESPCLTRSRGQAHSFISLQHAAVLSNNVLCNMSGVSMSKLNTREITVSQLGGLLGNAYCPQMVARVLSAGIMVLAEQCGMARVQVPDNIKDGSWMGYESGELLIEGIDRDPALRGPRGTCLRPDGVVDGPARGGPGLARGSPGPARGRSRSRVTWREPARGGSAAGRVGSNAINNGFQQTVQPWRRPSDMIRSRDL